MKPIVCLIAWVVAGSCLFACSKSKEKDSSLLPRAKGDSGEIILYMDTTLWSGELGDAVREVFTETFPVLPQPEPYFVVRSVDPLKFGGLLAEHRNIVFVTTFDSYSAASQRLQKNFSEESRLRLQQDPSVFMLRKENEFARGQLILHLFGQTADQLKENLLKNKQAIQDIFDSEEKKRQWAEYQQTAGEKDLMRYLKERYNFSLYLEKGFQMAKETDEFFWVRMPTVDYDLNIFMASVPYTSELQFSADSIIAWRNRIAKAHLYGNPENLNSFVITETLVPVRTDVTRFSGQYAVEARGLWKTNNFSMGGPFLSYTFSHPQTGRLYYIEGMIFAAGMQKRELIREMEVMLTSGRLSAP